MTIPASRPSRWLPWLIPLGLFVAAAAIRLIVATRLPFPATESSAYYVDVAQNLLAGNGLVANSVWSFATPPLVVPKPAFELWLPMSSLISAASMAVLGSTFWAAQIGGAALGALIAPLTWALGREAAHAQGLDARRGAAVALASGLLAAVLAPFVIGSVIPDSYTPFVVFMLAATLLVPRVLGVRAGLPLATPRPMHGRAGLVLGLALGLAYLSRQEVIWLGLVVLVLAWRASAGSTGSRMRLTLQRLGPVVAGGLITVTPWLLRNARDLGSPFPGQAIENALLRRNEDIFAFAERPALDTYLGQGLATVLGNPLAAAWDGFFNVLAVPAFPVGLLGLLAVLGMRHSPALRRPTALAVLLLSGALTFAATVLVFPVATLWGTFLHASGPLLAGLIVVAALGGDALLARISRARAWERPNVIIAPIALLAVTGLLAVLQVLIVARHSQEAQTRYEAIAVTVDAFAVASEMSVPRTIITDHPMWLASALERTAVALPDEPVQTLVELGRTFGTSWVVVTDERGRYPEALLADPAPTCLARKPVALISGDEPAWLFILDEACLAP